MTVFRVGDVGVNGSMVPCQLSRDLRFGPVDFPLRCLRDLFIGKHMETRWKMMEDDGR
jgi:hypothetical protein